MSFDKMFYLTAGLYFNFYNITSTANTRHERIATSEKKKKKKEGEIHHNPTEKTKKTKNNFVVVLLLLLLLLFFLVCCSHINSHHQVPGHRTGSISK